MIKITGIAHSAGMHSDQIPSSKPSPQGEKPLVNGVTYSPPSKAQTSLSPPPTIQSPISVPAGSKSDREVTITQPTIWGQQALEGNIKELRKKYGVTS